MRRRHLPLLTALACPIAVQSASAQSWPSRPIRIVVVFPPGGSSDIVARVLAEALATRMNARVVVDNRPGAGGTLGAQHVAPAHPFGGFETEQDVGGAGRDLRRQHLGAEAQVRRHDTAAWGAIGRGGSAG